MSDWNSLYGEKGIVQKKPSDKVFTAIELFKKNNVKKVLDLGCGTGRHTALFVKEGFDVFGCDFSKNALNIIKEVLPKNEFKQCNMTSLPYEDNSFDAIFCYQVIQHGMVNDIKKAINEMYRVLKKDGFLFLVVISTEHPKFLTGEEIEPNTKINTDDIDGHVPHHFFTEKEMNDFFKKFKIIDLIHFKGKSEANPLNKMASWKLFAKKNI